MNMVEVLCIYENGTMRPVETVLRSRVGGGIKEKMVGEVYPTK
jgi:hypothetical protein